jgi:hypothetical protein
MASAEALIQIAAPAPRHQMRGYIAQVIDLSGSPVVAKEVVVSLVGDGTLIPGTLETEERYTTDENGKVGVDWCTAPSEMEPGQGIEAKLEVTCEGDEVKITLAELPPINPRRH